MPPADRVPSGTGCGHDPAQFVTAAEGTGYCPTCERDAPAADRVTEAAPERTSAAQWMEVSKMAPREALAELERYVEDSIQRRSFGKTRATAALRVLKGACDAWPAGCCAR